MTCVVTAALVADGADCDAGCHGFEAIPSTPSSSILATTRALTIGAQRRHGNAMRRLRLWQAGSCRKCEGW